MHREAPKALSEMAATEMMITDASLPTAGASLSAAKFSRVTSHLIKSGRDNAGTANVMRSSYQCLLPSLASASGAIRTSRRFRSAAGRTRLRSATSDVPKARSYDQLTVHVMEWATWLRASENVL